MAANEFVGSHVRIKTEDGQYEGYIHRVDFSNKKLSLEKVVFLKDGEETRLPGLHHFFGNELESLDYLEDSTPPKVTLERETGKSLMGRKYVPPHLQRFRDWETKGPAPLSPDFIQQTDNVGNKEDKGAGKSGYDSGIDQEAAHQTNLDRFSHTVLNQIEDLFQEAVDFINSNKIIGVALEGINLGREGQLCWLQVATSDHVFLFDIKSLGRQCFNEGLKSILESEKILKVMHNCRFPADILWHQYNVKLVNIFDTQVADVFVYRNSHCGDWPRYVQGLPIVLMEYLELSTHQIYISKVRKSCAELDESFWAERPASEKMLDAAIKNVIYLRALRQVLLERMLTEYTAGVDLYLNHIRNKPQLKTRVMRESSHLLPVAFQELPVLAQRYSTKAKYVKDMGTEKDELGFRENLKRVMDPALCYIRDSAGKQPTFESKSQNATLVSVEMDAQKSEMTQRNNVQSMDCQSSVQNPDSPINGSESKDEEIVCNKSSFDCGSLVTSELTHDIRRNEEIPFSKPKASVGRGSSISLVKPEMIPDFSSVESGIALGKPDWSSLLPQTKSDFSGIVFKPAGANQSSIKKSSLSKEDRVSRKRVPTDYGCVDSEPSWDSKTSDTKPLNDSIFQDLEEDCFDEIPSRKALSNSVPKTNIRTLNSQKHTFPENFQTLPMSRQAVIQTEPTPGAPSLDDSRHNTVTSDTSLDGHTNPNQSMNQQNECLSHSQRSDVKKSDETFTGFDVRRKPVCPRLPKHVMTDKPVNSNKEETVITPCDVIASVDDEQNVGISDLKTNSSQVLSPDTLPFEKLKALMQLVHTKT